MGKLKEYKVDYTTELVTPDLAMEWIASSWGKCGRNFVPTQLEKIREYARLMADGHWLHTPDQDTIKFKDGVITDGRHRLHAILLSHTSQLCNIKRKASLEAA